MDLKVLSDRKHIIIEALLSCCDVSSDTENICNSHQKL